ncbi:MAG: CPBP family intramembrane metalloprotease [Ignavibacteria bacterium]|jgi:membrane protease YdiL (CAAX protease family)|nr:CPBP family intramembrane metalloprotease [Ignavibacteria bacterium]MCU7501711.1 CPBP family intramembrane metalloprotease [Ignavibacteria bacterium]MCU7516882.1 CPBP family intramembrane metalloprotease [Ignavibacteria bacterium]
MKLKSEMKNFLAIVKSLDKKVITVFISVALLQTVSWYYTSGRFYQMAIEESPALISPEAELRRFLFWFLGDFGLLFLIPCLIIKVFFKKKLSDYGLKRGDYSFGLRTTAFALLIMLIIVWFVSALNSFSENYPTLFSAREDWNAFFLFESALLLYMLAWEFIWRGYMLFGLEEKFNYYTVLVQMLPFVILHNGKPVLETFGAIVGALILGVLALRTRSIIYGIIIHFGTLFSIDIISILRYRTGEYGTGLNSILNIIRNL